MQFTILLQGEGLEAVFLCPIKKDKTMHLRQTNKRPATLRNRSIYLLSLITISLIFLSASVSCANSIPQEFTNSENLWKSQSLRNYDFTLERQCFCPEDWRGPVEIQVRDGNAVTVTYIGSDLPVTEGKFDNADTIDKLFTILKDAYTGQGEFNQKADSINVTYNTQMGYPATFFIDVSKTIADEEQGYTVTKLIAQ